MEIAVSFPGQAQDSTSFSQLLEFFDNSDKKSGVMHECDGTSEWRQACRYASGHIMRFPDEQRNHSR